MFVMRVVPLCSIMSPMYVPGQWVLAVYVQNGRSKCAPVKKSFLFWVCAGTRICLLHLHVVDRGHVLLQLPTALLEGVGQRGALSGEETAGGDDRPSCGMRKGQV